MNYEYLIDLMKLIFYVDQKHSNIISFIGFNLEYVLFVLMVTELPSKALKTIDNILQIYQLPPRLFFSFIDKR